MKIGQARLLPVPVFHFQIVALLFSVFSNICCFIAPWYGRLHQVSALGCFCWLYWSWAGYCRFSLVTIYAIKFSSFNQHSFYQSMSITKSYLQILKALFAWQDRLSLVIQIGILYYWTLFEWKLNFSLEMLLNHVLYWIALKFSRHLLWIQISKRKWIEKIELEKSDCIIAASDNALLTHSFHFNLGFIFTFHF